MVVSTAELVKQAMNAMQQELPLDEDVVVQTLIRNGASESDANQAVTLLPTAFTRVLLGGKGIIFADYFILDRGDVNEYYALTDNPIYMQALDYANSNNLNSKQLMRVASYSSEFSAINNALQFNADLSGVKMSPTLIFGHSWELDQNQIDPPKDESKPNPRARATMNNRPWWQFWKN